MKTALIILITIMLLLLVQLVMAITILNTEKQKYELISKEGKFEIRKYSQSILASVKLKGSYNEISTPGFRTLASYIFGSNKTNTKIKMTAPVRIGIGDTATMSFVMPSKFKTIDELPTPKNANISLNKVQEELTASISFGGYANDKRIAKKTKLLKKMLEEKGIKHKNDFQFLGYNPPFQVLGRKNEILVSVE